MKKAWFTLSELAKETLPGMPGTRQAWAAKALREGWDKTEFVRARTGRGAGSEYHYSLLPGLAQAELVRRYGQKVERANDNSELAPADWRAEASANAWAFYDAAPDSRKNEAKRRHAALMRYDELYPQVGFGPAARRVAKEVGVTEQTIRAWIDIRRRTSKHDLLPALLPNKRGTKGKKIEIQQEVWDFICGDYLRKEKPSYASCYERLERAAPAQGWALPNKRTLERRLAAVAAEVKVLARRGEEHLEKLYPAQKRDRSGFHALEALNADGHKWDVFCHLEDGKPFRPITVAFQDLYSGKFVGWRHDVSESKDLIRLAFGDVCMSYGIPDVLYLDNGRAFASKWLTGGIKNRYRFKVKAEEPVGIITQLGVEVKWTTPYHGQAKPIERAFRDFAMNIANGPWFAGAYTGNSPVNKPDNYGERSIPFEQFKRIVDHEIMMHNARKGRKSDVCKGKLSFNEAFDESYAKSLIRKPTVDQLRLCLMAAEGVKANKRDGALNFMENRYWSPALVAERGNGLVVRFDPAKLHTDLPVYRRDGTLVCMAKLQEASGFADTEAAREHARARKDYVRGAKQKLAAERRLSARDIVTLMPDISEILPEPKAIPAMRPVLDNLAVKVANEDAAETAFFESLQRGLRLVRGGDDFDDSI